MRHVCRSRASRQQAVGRPVAPSARRPGRRKPGAQKKIVAGQSGAMQQVRSLVDKVARSMAAGARERRFGHRQELVALAIARDHFRPRSPSSRCTASAIPEHCSRREFFAIARVRVDRARMDRPRRLLPGGQRRLSSLDESATAAVRQSSCCVRSRRRFAAPVGAVPSARSTCGCSVRTHNGIFAAGCPAGSCSKTCTTGST